jgi:type IV secretory pathway VirB10-like protein
MKTTPKTLLAAALCAAALSSFACGRPSEETKTAETVPAPAPATTQTYELAPEPRSVVVEEATPAPTADQQSELDARERELAQRQADLEARERELQARERARPKARAPRPQPRPQPRVEAPAPVEPAPEDQTADLDVQPEPPAVAAPDEPEAPAAAEPEPEERPEPVTVPAGTVLEVELLNTVSSESSRVGDTFRARIAGSVRADGRVAIPSGSEVVGEVTQAVPLRKVGGQAKLSIRFTDLVLPDGTTVPIDASFVQAGRNETGRDAATIGGGAAAGAILGRILNKGDRGKGGVIGAILGAAAGTVIASRTPGEPVTFREGDVVDLKLDGSVRIHPRR